MDRADEAPQPSRRVERHYGDLGIHFEYEEVLGKPWRRGIVGFAKRRASTTETWASEQ